MAIRRPRPVDPNAYPPAPGAPEMCDKCHVADARWKVIGPRGCMLTFCIHHYRQNEIALRVAGWVPHPMLKG